MTVATADLASAAMACLRVSILSAPGGQTPAELQALVAKVINAFLETRWQYPRQFEQMTPYAFVLTDPRAKRMDTRALKALAAELQLKLFGVDGDGEVSLLMFEGSDVEVHRFARLSAADVERMMAGETLDPPFEGTLERILADTVAVTSDPKPTVFDDLEVDPAPRMVQARPRTALEPVYGGLYLSLTNSFMATIALCRRPGQDLRLVPDLGSPQPIDGLSAEQFDEGCIEAVVEALARGGPGLILAPLSFSSLVKPAGRRTYARFLCHLPAEHKDRLGAAIYDAPRDPSFFALSTIRRYLDPFFGELNLHVADPAFEVEKLPAGMIASVTLQLPDRESSARMAAIRRFAGQREAYRRKRVLPGITGLVTRAELDACLSLRVPVLGGPAVAALGPRPLGARVVDAAALPAA
jgi:hypothetical protein